MSETTPIIRIRGLTKAFRGHLGIGKTTVVDGLDLEVGRGEVFGLLGHNGAGKTTTLKLLLGLLKPDGGTIELCGGAPGDPASRVRVGFLPEHPYFYDYLSGREFLDFYARLHGFSTSERRDRVQRALERVGLTDAAERPLRKYSKGMIQRVGLAQAIQHDPDLVILDEPMSGLDPIGRRDVRDIILELREAGKTVFFSSHILQDAEMLCDRVAILRKGKMSAMGRLRDMISPEARWVEVAVRGTLPTNLDVTVVNSSGNEHLLRVEDAGRLAVVLQALEAQGAELVSIWTRRDSLEDLFLRTVEPERGMDKVAHG